jgi:serine/threonine-protein kinase
MPARPTTIPVRKRVWNVGRFLIILAALIATFGVFFLAGMRVTTRAREVQVPDLVGKSTAEARDLVTALGLNLRFDEPRRPDKAIPADHVLTQEPAAGSTIRRQRSVRVRISDGQRAPVVPVVTNLPEHTAQVTLAAEQITIGYQAEVRSAEHQPGVVVAQDPPAGQRAAIVNIVLNRAEAGMSYVVPDLIGTLGSRAVDVLRGQQFRVAISAEVPYPGLPAGIVVRQTPQAGFRIQQSDPITIEVSR